MNICALTMGKIDDWLSTIPSKHTRKNYVNGVSKFETWFGDSITKLIKQDKEATRAVERFFVHLKEQHPQNTARNVTNAAIQFLKHYGTNVRPKRSLRIYKTERAIDQHMLTISEVQQMAKVGNLDEQVMLGILLLGLRVGDAKLLKKENFENSLDRKPPIELKLRARKEGTIYETFVTEELRNLLKQYLPTLNNEWLFAGIRKGSHVKDETLNNRLRKLAERAGIKLNGRLTWHCGRKVLMRQASQIGINVWNIKRMVGKSIPISDDTYLAGLNLREDFIKLSNVIKLKQATMNNKVGTLEGMVETVGKALAKSLSNMVMEQLRTDGVISLATKEEELDPMKDWLKILENYIVFDEVIPPTPERKQRKNVEVRGEKDGMS